MAGLNNIREAYLSIYQTQLDEEAPKRIGLQPASPRLMKNAGPAKVHDPSKIKDKKVKRVEEDVEFVDEAMSEDEKEMRRLAAQERRAGKSDRMDAKVAKKYADSEARSASREDKKSKGKHIHGMADSVELEGEQIDEISSHLALTASQKADNERRKASVAGDNTRAAEKARQASAIYAGVAKRRAREKTQSESAVPGKPAERLGAVTAIPKSEQEAARERILAKTKAIRDKKLKEEVKLDERALDATEKKEKERLVKGMKKSASSFKKRYGERAKSVMYATATKQAKERMDTSKSDRRYGVER